MKTYIFPPTKYFLFPLFPNVPHKECLLDIQPDKHDIFGYRMNEAGTIGTYTQLHECYIDTRYEAILRLFYYLHPERKPTGKSIYSDSEIGKSLPILNF